MQGKPVKVHENGHCDRESVRNGVCPFATMSIQTDSEITCSLSAAKAELGQSSPLTPEEQPTEDQSGATTQEVVPGVCPLGYGQKSMDGSGAKCPLGFTSGVMAGNPLNCTR